MAASTDSKIRRLGFHTLLVRVDGPDTKTIGWDVVTYKDGCGAGIFRGPDTETALKAALSCLEAKGF